MYDSLAERDRAAELRLLEQAGDVTAIIEQIVVPLTAGIRWKIDFRYEENGRTIYEDVKGVWSREARLKRRLWKVYGPGVLRITRRRGRKAGFLVVEEIVPQP